MIKHKHGGDVYHYENCIDFSANCNPLGTPESVKRAVTESLSHVEDYPRVDCGPLKEAIGVYEGVEPGCVVCGNGAAELIFSLCRAIKPVRALVPAPTFAEYAQALDSVGCDLEYCYLSGEEGFAVGDSFVKALHRELDVVFLCNPNNPTGLLIEKPLLLEILEKCREFQILLVVDECFLDFVKEPAAYTLKEQLTRYPNLFLLKAFTKRYAMAGIRLGYGLCGDKALLERIEYVTQPWNVSTMAQEAGLAALKETEYVEAGRRLVFSQAEEMMERMKALGLKVYPSQANYIFFRGPEDLFEQCVKAGVLIRDCSNYPGLCKGFYRVAVKNREQNQKLLKALEETAGGRKNG